MVRRRRTGGGPRRAEQRVHQRDERVRRVDGAIPQAGRRLATVQDGAAQAARK